MESGSVPEKGKGFILLQRPRKDLELRQPPIQWVRRVERRDFKPPTHLHIVEKLRMIGV
jgi:hypothetical protein